MSRDKGSRGEREFRDVARMYGFEADRVPLSGAATGFKGDVRFSKAGKVYHAEIKLRKDAFKRIYVLFDKYSKISGDDKLGFSIAGVLVNMSTSLIGAMEDYGTYDIVEHMKDYKVYVRTFSKILNLRKLVGTCDLLVVRDDRKPFLFIRYR
jgi:hypothetical protein